MDRPVKLLRRDDSIHIARLCDLSLAGLSLLADAAIEDDSLVVQLRLPQVDEATNQEIVVGCRLVHRTPTPDSDLYKLGMCIDELAPDAAALIKQYLSYKLNYFQW